MATNYQIYLRDILAERNNTSSKRTIPVIQQIIYDTATTNFDIQRINPTELGYLITHNTDKELNYIFNPVIIDKLKNLNLKAELGNPIKKLREIVISEIPDYIYFKTTAELSQNIETKNPFKVLTLSKHISPSNKKQYLFITVDSIEARDQTIIKGSIILFDKHLTAQKAYQQRSKHRSTTHTYQPQRFYTNNSAQGRGQAPPPNSAQGRDQAPPPNSPVDNSTYNLQGSYINYSDQWRGLALPQNSNWGGIRPHLTSPPTDTSIPPPS